MPVARKRKVHMRAKLAFRRNARQHIAERLTACDGLPRLHKHAGKPRIGADAFIRLPDFDAPAPKLVADTGEYCPRMRLS